MQSGIGGLAHRRIQLDPARCFLKCYACAALFAVVAFAHAQAPSQPTSPPSPQQSQPTPAQPEIAAPAPQSSQNRPAPSATAGAFTLDTVHGLKEDQLKQLLVGKPLYLRGGYLDNNLEFDERGKLRGHSPQGSYTLSQIQINKVKLTKHKIELRGDRYALHFLGAAPFEDPTAATDRVRITPRKKVVHISIDREEIEKPQKEKSKEKDKDKESRKHHDKKMQRQPVLEGHSAESASASSASPDAKHDLKEKEKALAEARSTHALLVALDSVFSPGIDSRMIAAMPDFWKLYYQAAEAKTAFKPADPGVYRQNDVDQKAKLISSLDPPSNELAQKSGIAGIALYHAIVDSDGKVKDVVAGRPIGFGLDESAEQTIRSAVFQPAMKAGKPVPVMLDLVVSFRIYSKRTSQPAVTQEEASDALQKTVLPGPYTLQDAKVQLGQSQTATPPANPQP